VPENGSADVLRRSLVDPVLKGTGNGKFLELFLSIHDLSNNKLYGACGKYGITSEAREGRT
jgi:hypothetical protein